MNGDSNETQIAQKSLRVRSKASIADILQVKIPEEIAEIDKLLASSVCSTSPARPLGTSGQQNTVIDNLCRAGVSCITGPSNDPMFCVPSNESVVALINGLEGRLLKMREHASDLDHWMTLSIPMAESGCDVGAETRRIASGWLRRLRYDCEDRHQMVADYHSTRTAILSRFLARPGIYDFLLAVERFDIAQLELFKLYALKIKNSYEEILHFYRSNMNHFN